MVDVMVARRADEIKKVESRRACKNRVERKEERGKGRGFENRKI